MPVLHAHAYGFASTFKMRDLQPCFSGARVRPSKTQIVAEYGPDRFAVGFDFGAVVFVNVASEERARVIGAILERVATDEPHAPLEEDFLIETREGVPPQGIVSFDRVVVSELTAPAVELITLLLAQSVSIDYYEEDLQEILVTLDRQTDRMAKKGRLSGSPRDLMKFVGSSIATKNQIIAALAVLDKPAVTWEAEPLDRMYNHLRSMLEIDERYKSLEYKLRTIQETLELFLDLQQTRRGFLLEATIMMLILAELGIGVLTLLRWK